MRDDYTESYAGQLNHEHIGSVPERRNQKEHTYAPEMELGVSSWP